MLLIDLLMGNANFERLPLLSLLESAEAREWLANSTARVWHLASNQLYGVQTVEAF